MLKPTECQITLTIDKIYNSNDSGKKNTYQFMFYQQDTQQLIFQQIIHAQKIHTNILFDYPIKISYPTHQHQIQVKITQIFSKIDFKQLADFTIDLNLLKEHQVQYYPIGKNQQVLKIVLGAEHLKMNDGKQQVKKSYSSQKNQMFIQERQNFLQQINQNKCHIKSPSNSRNGNIQKSQKVNQGNYSRYNSKHFIEKRSSSSSHLNAFQLQNRPKLGINSNLVEQNQFRKSLIENYSDTQNKHLKRNLSERNSSQDSRRSEKSQKHRLLLKNLDVVACENEYYADSATTIQRKADFQVKIEKKNGRKYLGSNYF